MSVRLTLTAEERASLVLPDPLPSDVTDALDLARDLGRSAPLPGAGATDRLWSLLATLAAHDLGVARAIEPHLDAIAILAQADEPTDPNLAWGVFAAEGGPPLEAHPHGGGWRLRGEKPWCSLAARLDAALVTAHLPDGMRGLFAVDLRHPGVTVIPDAWHARGLAEIPSGPVRFDGVPARAIGATGWYLARPGFWWGGIGVAACWYGGAVGVAQRLRRAVRDRPSELGEAALGRVDVALHAARACLAEAVDDVDARRGDPKLLAQRVRAVVAEAGDTVLLSASRTLGPGPLAREAEHAKRVADLGLYLRQHHAERDLASIGRLVAASGDGEDNAW